MKRYFKDRGASNKIMGMDKETWNLWQIEARINGILGVDAGKIESMRN